ncbi:permease for cytosine/purines, uracil, thiamine, allantoin-domain-containing protein [Xylariaceae sp. FL0255]|nr:permease for cytosine/purines, uracil, thiamine, allantoin-domain-containing protein [Xylariaceae sp. FL0255]
MTPTIPGFMQGSWPNEDIDVVPSDKQTWWTIDYLWLWLSDGANIGTMQQVVSIVALGLSWRKAAVVIAIGNIIIAAGVALNGAIGSYHHVPFPIASRASMGINTYIGASCALIMLPAIWPPFKDYPNDLPANAGFTSNRLIASFVFWAVQFPLPLIHPNKMRWLFFVKSIAPVVADFAVLGLPAYVAGVNIAISGNTTHAINILDLTRYARHSSATIWQLRFIPLAGFNIYGQTYRNPTSIITLWTDRAAAFFCAFSFGLATLGTNISTNSIAASNDLDLLAPRWLDLRRGAVVTALLAGWATAPWKIQANYWIIRSRRIDVPALYQNKGPTLLVVVSVNLPGLIHAIKPAVRVSGGYADFYKASWLTSVFMASVIYIGLSKLFPPHESMTQGSEHYFCDSDGVIPGADTADQEIEKC